MGKRNVSFVYSKIKEVFGIDNDNKDDKKIDSVIDEIKRKRDDNSKKKFVK